MTIFEIKMVSVTPEDGATGEKILNHISVP